MRVRCPCLLSLVWIHDYMFIFVVFGLLCSNVNGSIVVAEVTLIFLGLMASLLCYQRASVGGCYGWWLPAHADLSGSHGVIVMPSERERVRRAIRWDSLSKQIHLDLLLLWA